MKGKKEEQRDVPELTELAEERREQAYEKYEIIRVCLEEGVSQPEASRLYGIPVKTLQRWIARYRESGLRGLARPVRSDAGKRRALSEEVVKVVEGLALRKPRRSVATIQRQASAIALQQGWEEPSYRQVRAIVGEIPPALRTLAH